MIVQTKAKERAEFLRIYQDRTERDRLGLKTVREIAKHCGITVNTAYKAIRATGSAEEDDVDKEFSDFLKHIRKAGMDGKNSRYADLYATLKGWKQKPKEETRDDFSPADYIRIGRETKEAIFREYQEGGGRCPVCGFTPILRNETCVSTEPEHGAHREVEAVALPSRPD